MDDNKILTLASNERIPLKPHMRMLFEIRDLKFATPATVSRAGILYISDDKGSQWNSYVKSWSQKYPETEADKLQSSLLKLFEKYVGPALSYVFRSCKFLIPMSKISMVITICKSLDGFLKEKIPNLEYTFVYVVIWAIGGSLSEKDGEDYRKVFSSWWRGVPE
jgi:dynein heavy chain